MNVVFCQCCCSHRSPNLLGHTCCTLCIILYKECNKCDLTSWVTVLFLAYLNDYGYKVPTGFFAKIDTDSLSLSFILVFSVESCLLTISEIQWLFCKSYSTTPWHRNFLSSATGFFGSLFCISVVPTYRTIISTLYVMQSWLYVITHIGYSFCCYWEKFNLYFLKG